MKLERRNFIRLIDPSVVVAFAMSLCPQLNGQSCSVISERVWTEKIGGCWGNVSDDAYWEDDCFYLIIYGDAGELSYETIEYTETMTLCFADACSPGQEDTSTDDKVIDEGMEQCTDWDLLRLPDADPELCGGCDCECDDAEASSVSYKMRLGPGFNGNPLHYLRIHRDTLDPDLYTPRVLQLSDPGGMKIYRAPDYSMRQILGPRTLCDVIVETPTSFRVDIYEIEDDSELKRDGDGYLIPEGEPFRTHRFSDPEDIDEPAYRIVSGKGKSIRENLFTWDAETDVWTLQTGDKAPFYDEALESYDEDTGILRKTKQLRDTETGLTKQTIHEFLDFPFGRRLMSTEKKLGGKRLSKDVFEYFDQAGEIGYGRLKSRRLHDGSWERFEYDSRGRLAKTVRPWKNSPFESDESEVAVETATYLPVNPSSVFYHPLATMAKIDTVIVGVPVSTTYRVQTQDPADGGRIKVEEQAAQPGAPFGSPGNQRTVTHFYPTLEATPSSGQLRSSQQPDGTLITYTYEAGDYSGEEGVPGNFTPRIGGYFTRITKTEGTVDHPNGFPQKSVATVTIQSPSDKDLLVESRIRPEGSEDYSEVLSWTGYGYDVHNRKSIARDATGIVGEYRYNPCCGKLEWQRDANGIETYYMRDDADRVTAKIVSAPGIDDIETFYEYDLLGNVTRQTVVAGDIVRESIRTYDDEGRLVAEKSPDGLVTKYEHDEANRRTVTILPGNITQVGDRYLDGQLHAVQGSAVVAQFYDYGVVPETGDRWSQTTLAKPDGPRWSRTYTDPLGRTFMSEAPGHGDNVVVANYQSYDDAGRLVGSATGWKIVSALGGADDEKDGEVTLVGPPTLYVYDSETGDLEFVGQDIDRNRKLEPGGVDQVTRQSIGFEKHGHHWFSTSKAWSYPVEWKGKPYLVGETRQRYGGLGVPDEDYPAAVLSGESILIAPGGDPESELVTATLTYRDRENATTVTESIAPNGIEQRQTSLAGRVVATEEIVGGVPCCRTTFEYDPLGRRVATVDPRTGKTSVVYDTETGRVTTQVDPEGRETKLEYYPADHASAGKLATTINPDGKQQYTAYNERGQQTGVWGETAQPIAYRYNDYGELIAMETFQTLPNGNPSTDPADGTKTQWLYHEATGALAKKEYADGKGPEYHYTPAGQLRQRVWARASETDHRPLTTDYSYDPLTAALTKTSYSDIRGERREPRKIPPAGDPQGETSVGRERVNTEIIYTYDDSGRLAKVTDPTGTRQFEYDIKGQILAETVTLAEPIAGKPLTYRIDRSYTDLGQPSKVALSSPDLKPATESLNLRHEVQYTWNTHGQLATVSSPAGDFAYTYDEHTPSLLTRMTGPVHSAETTYEPHRNLITGVTNVVGEAKGDGQKAEVVSSYTYANDILGRRSEISQGGSAFAMLGLGDHKVEVAYNTRSEVTGASYKTGNEEFQSYSYVYDGIGNRERFEAEGNRQKAEVSYEANALNQYASISLSEKQNPQNPVNPVNPVHDFDGNLLEDENNHYTWNGENRLVRVESKDGRSIVDYAYDYQGRRTTKRIQSLAANRQPPTAKSYFYIYDGWNLLAEIESTPAEDSPTTNYSLSTTYHTWGRDLSGTLQSAGGVGGLLAITEADAHHYPAYDANGNVVQMLDGAGATVAAYEYDPFGNVAKMGGDYAAENPWRFSTKPVEEETGWLYYGYRCYMPETGRWASRDPIEETGGINLYGFVENQGVGRVDFFGLSSKNFLLSTELTGRIPLQHNQSGYIHTPGSSTENVTAKIKVNYQGICRETSDGWIPSQLKNGNADVSLTYSSNGFVENPNAEPDSALDIISVFMKKSANSLVVLLDNTIDVELKLLSSGSGRRPPNTPDGYVDESCEYQEWEFTLIRKQSPAGTAIANVIMSVFGGANAPKAPTRAKLDTGKVILNFCCSGCSGGEVTVTSPSGAEVAN